MQVRAAWAAGLLWLSLVFCYASTTAATEAAALGMLVGAGEQQGATAGKDTLYIPKILHQSYLPDLDTLDKMSTSPRSHFRRDWRRSCQLHNPGYQYMFWDQTSALEFVTEHYPHMLTHYNAVSKYVLKSDILRVMILDKLGGVWLDIDTECFAPVEPILRGFQLVAQAEWSFQLCNSHMAGVPGHPIWPQLMSWFIDKVKQGVQDPLKHTGPVALTSVTKRHIQPANTRNMSLIVGAWKDPAYPDGQFRAYGLQEEWYLPCKWAKSYMSDCQGKLARSKAVVRQLANGVNVSLEFLAQHPNPPDSVRELIDTAKIFRKIRGSHEYANSWTRWAYSDGLKALIRSQEAVLGLQPFFSTPAVFEEYPGWVPGGCVDSQDDMTALTTHQLCPAVLRRAAKAGECTVLSIRGRHDQFVSNTSLNLDLERYITHNFACDVRVISLQPRRQTEVEGRMTLVGEPMQLGPYYDQYSHPPTYTLPGLLKAQLKPNQSLTLLHIDCGYDCRLWEVLNQLQLTGSLELKRVGSLLVDLGVLSSRKRHILNTVYQHLYQEIGFVGYSWGRSQGPGGLRRREGILRSAVSRDGAAKVVIKPSGAADVRTMAQEFASVSTQQGIVQIGSSQSMQSHKRSLRGTTDSTAEHRQQDEHKAGALHLDREAVGIEQDGGSRTGRSLLQAPVGRASQYDFSLPPLRLGFARVL